MFVVALRRELRHERGAIAEESRVREVEYGPEVAEPVLHRSAGERDPAAGRDASQLLGCVAGGVLDGLGLVEHHAGPRTGGQRLDVSDRGAVCRYHQVGVVHLRPQVVGRGAGGTVVDDHSQTGCEAGRLRGPVADHRGWGDHECGLGPVAAGQMGQERRRLAQTHVEGKAAAELHRVEEPEPREGVALVAAQGADEPLGGGGRLGRRAAGPGQEVGSPARPDDGRGPAQGRSLQADGMAQDLGAGELRPVGALGQRSSGLGQIGVVDLDPSPARVEQRPGLGGQTTDVGRSQLDVVEHG